MNIIETKNIVQQALSLEDLIGKKYSSFSTPDVSLGTGVTMKSRSKRDKSPGPSRSIIIAGSNLLEVCTR